MHLEQLNLARPREPLESPLLAEFVAALEPVNTLADRGPGFVWRFQDEAGDATGIRATGRGFTFREHFAEDPCRA